MTEPFSPGGDLAALWQSEAPAFDPADVRKAAEHDRRIQRRTVNAVLAFGLVVWAFVLWMELQGALTFPFLLSTLILASIFWQIWVSRRARRAMPDVARLDPEGLLKHAIARARTTLRNARIIYAVYPASVGLGVALGPILASGEPKGDAFSAVAVSIALALVAAVLIGAAFGVRMAAAARVRIAVLEERLMNLRAEP